MARDGSGTYSLPAGNPVAAGSVIQSNWANTTLTDIAAALTASLSKDGQTVPTANLPMGGFKFTGVGAATSGTDLPLASQVQNGTFNVVGTPAGTNTITGTLPLGAVGFTAGQIIVLVPAGNNTGATTLAINGGTAYAVKNIQGAALSSGDLVSGQPTALLWDGSLWRVLRAQNLSDLQSAAAARINLGLGTAAVVADSAYVHVDGSVDATAPTQVTIAGTGALGANNFARFKNSNGNTNGKIWAWEAVKNGADDQFGLALKNDAGAFSTSIFYAYRTGTAVKRWEFNPSIRVCCGLTTDDGATTLQSDTGKIDTLTSTTAGITTANIGQANVTTQLNVTAAQTGGGGTSAFQAWVADTAAYNASQKAGYGFGVKYTSGGAVTGVGSIRMGKETATDGDVAAFMAFDVRASSSNPAEAMRINSSGYLGFNTTTPPARVTVAHDLANTLDSTAFRLQSAADQTSYLLFGGSSVALAYSFFQSYKEGTGSGVRSLALNPSGGSIITGDMLYPINDNAVTCGKSGNRWAAVWAVNGTIQTSDARQKTNIKDAALGLDFIKSLRPVSFTWINGGNTLTDVPGETMEVVETLPNKIPAHKEEVTPEQVVVDEPEQVIPEHTEAVDGVDVVVPEQIIRAKTHTIPAVLRDVPEQITPAKTRTVPKKVMLPKPGVRIHHGLLAQDVKVLTDKIGVDFAGYIKADVNDPNSEEGLRYDQFIAPLIRAVQELTAIVESNKVEIAALKVKVK